jgi:hypothetical protein
MASGFNMAGGGRVSFGLNAAAYTFNPLIRSKASGEPVRDDAGRTTKWVRWVFEISGIVVPINPNDGTDTNAVLVQMRKALMSPGKAFHYDDRGFGSLFAVNDPTATNGDGNIVWDCKWGPKCLGLEFTPIGSKKAAMVTWKVEVCIPECPGSVFEGKPLAFCYDVDWQLAGDGLQTITTTGTLEIPLTYRNGPALIDNADNYRRSIVNMTPLGFKRSMDFKLSKDRTTLAFTITDTEIPIAYPEGVVKIQVDHEVSNTTPMVFSNWNVVISGSVTVTPTKPKGWAWDAFLSVAARRLLWTLEGFVNINPNSPNRLSMLITRFRAKESIFELTSQFEVTYVIIGSSLQGIMEATGLWQPVGTDWKKWRDSLEDNAHWQRGVLDIRYWSKDDSIIDLCGGGPQQPESPGRAGINPQAVLSSQPPDPSHPPVITDVLTLTPDPNNPPQYPQPVSDIPFDFNYTYFEYYTWLFIFEEHNFVRHKPIGPGVKITLTKPLADPTNLQQMRALQDYSSASVKSNTPDVLQRLVSPTVTVVLQGYASRLCFPIVAPQLIQFQGKPVTLTRKFVTSPTVTGYLGPYPIVSVAWRLEFAIAQSLDPKLPVLANPMLNSPGSPQGSLFQPDNNAAGS